MRSLGLALAVSALIAVLGVGAANGTRSSGAILTVGTTFYIDTLNPFVGIET